MLHHTIIPWSPERMRRLIFSLICSSGKAENVPKPTSVDITSSQVRIASVEVSADDIQAAHEIHLVPVGSALYRVPEIVTRGRFPDGGESDSTWRTQEARHVGS